MHIKNLIIQATSTDVKNFLALQNKFQIKKVKFNKNNIINLIGDIEFLGKSITIKSDLVLLKFQKNIIYVKVENFSVFNFNFLNKIFVQIFNYYMQAFSCIKGVESEGKFLKIDLNKIIKKNYNIVNLENLEILNIKISENYVELILSEIVINSSMINVENILC